MISLGEAPEEDGTNLFFDRYGNDCRGWLIATSPDGTEAIMVGINFFRGAALLVREDDPDRYPTFVRFVTLIPFGWRLEGMDVAAEKLPVLEVQ